MTNEQRATSERIVAAGIESGRLLRVRRFRPDDVLYAVVRIEPGARALDGGPAEGDATALTGTEWAELTGSIDVPAEDAAVTGDLLVRGWARIPGRDLEVTVLLDGAPRIPLHHVRTPRADVQTVLPYLGNCATAGYEDVFVFQPGDEGEHELSVVFRGPDDRVRHYPWRKFTWRPSSLQSSSLTTPARESSPSASLPR